MHILYRRKWLIAAGLFPALFFYVVFALYPIVNSFYYSFFKWDGFTQMHWLGLGNYAELIRDSVFWNSLRNNVYIVVTSILLQIPAGLFFAIILNGRILKGRALFKTVFFMPVVLSTVVISLFWSMMYNYQVGLINSFFRIVGMDSWVQNWLGEPRFSIFMICIMIIWQYSGFYMIIFLAALQNISSEVLEAADIDGASGLRKVWSVTLPMLSDTIFTSIALCISGSLRTFDIIYVMTKGGPNHATEVMATYMFQSTFSAGRYGYGSTISTAIFIVSFLLIVISRMAIRKLQR
ncbi:carbohydrate ABC transporter permease [Paenibacillus beijingensis]|uniref:Sugar ABC transporter permease n=1 Tax=Paenibacillus beijingensis TaxID=1126833 RepID=A0A0D5NEF1_9BACL|nr:sugar ABC transporter permease [Paenibacillus beijingensis]AJY73754.1 sugar ABC transporter permease [Paenibacillus beijingensis]